MSSRQPTPSADGSDECCVCGAWFPDEGDSGWVLCDYDNCDHTVCSECIFRLGLTVSSDEPYYCPTCRPGSTAKVHIPPKAKGRGRGKARGGKTRNAEHRSAAGKSALELATEKAAATITAGSRGRPRKRKGDGYEEPIGANAEEERSSASCNAINKCSTQARVENEAKTSHIVGSRVLEAVAASEDLHRFVMPKHRTDQGEDENQDGTEATNLTGQQVASSATISGAPVHAAADLAATSPAAAPHAPLAAADTAVTASSSKKKTSADGRGGNRGPKRQVFARRDQRRRNRLIREEEQKRKEEEERIAREAAQRQGFSGNLVSSANERGSSTAQATKSAPNSTRYIGPHSDESSIDFEDVSNKNGSEDENYFEVDAYLARRNGRRGVEYLIKWKGCPESEATWEPHKNLCDSAHKDAKEWWKKEQKRRERIVENERNLGLLPRGDQGATIGGQTSAVEDDVVGSAIETNAVSKEASEDVHVSQSQQVDQQSPEALPSNAVVGWSDSNWTWDDASQVNFRAVKRISVHDEDAREQVTEARMNGTPVVLTGHIGWAGFASRWLRKRKGLDTNRSTDDVLPEAQQMLDLSDPDWYLDVKAMADDIGSEEVPVVKRDYNEAAPISGTITASRFLETSWPSSTGIPESADETASSSALYLHQWQFPLSETAAQKLCNQSEPLPNDIMGEDLLKYWLCRLPDCPLQYLFMGREETMSKLHKDPGGLAISIAPLVGEKECVLVHRDDGQQCLYHLSAPLEPEEIDLDAFPLLSQARIYKTIISPGEILLMPQGTYHQCRNVTACLSYSRFHLDLVNLRAFVNSYFDGDAPEMEQDEVLWNCAHSLMEVIDAATDEARKNLDVEQDDEGENYDEKKEDGPVTIEKGNLDPSLTRAVDTLRCLRHFAREFTRKLELRATIKGKGFARVSSDENSISKDDNTPKKWRQLVDDCDVCLHEFRYRYSREVPDYKPRRSVGRKKFAMPAVTMRGSAALMANRHCLDPGNSAGAKSGRKSTKPRKRERSSQSLGTTGQGRLIGDKLYNPDIPGAVQCPKITARGKRCRNVCSANSHFCLLHTSLVDQSASTNAEAPACSSKRATKKRCGKGSSLGGGTIAPIVAFESEMETAWTCLPQATQLSKTEKKILAAQIDKLTPGSRIAVDIMGRKCTADVLEIREEMYTVFMSYEDYPNLYNEYLPFDRLRTPSIGGGTLTDMNPENIRPGALVIALVGEKRDVSTHCYCNRNNYASCIMVCFLYR